MSGKVPDGNGQIGLVGMGLRILIIDDDDFMRSVIAQLLRRLQVVDIHEASNGSDALAVIERAAGRDFDLLICDIEMPGADGMEFMRRFGAAGGRAPLLLLSGKSAGVLHSVEIMGAAFGLTILGAAHKPPTLAILRDALENCQAAVKPSTAAPPLDFSIEDIRTALAGGQFEAFFQPKVRLETREICGCEALVRWRHPRHGVLAPAAFVARIEADGLMDAMTWTVLEQACAWCRRWQQSGLRLPVSVNLSMSSFESAQLGARIVDIVHAAGLVASDLILEITETIAMLDVARCLETLVRFRLQGFGLSIDDFGTGFASFQQLERVPYTELKVDREFVNGAAEQSRLRTVLESSVSIARRLGMVSVGEGVETAADWNCLREVGCDVAQGYFIARPMAGEEFMAWAESWQQSALTAPAVGPTARDHESGRAAVPRGAAAIESMADHLPVIIAADDDAIARRTLQLYLSEIPAELHIYSDGDAVLAASQRLRPDLLLLDIEMPGLRGDDVCRQLRLTPHSAAIPVIIITGDESVTARRNALLAGATDVITKPVQKLELLMRVRNLLALQHSLRELHQSRLQLELHKTRQMRGIFERYVSPRLVDRILRDDDTFERLDVLGKVRRCHAVTLFADLRGFTHLSEILQASEVAQLLNEFFALLVEVTHKYEGTNLGMAGDCLLVGFNVPYHQDDAEVRAVLAAYDMLVAFEELAGAWRRTPGVRAGLGIGINAGNVVAGNIGAPSYVNYTLIGDTVNVASRLKDRARAGEILVTEPVIRKLGAAHLEFDVVKVPVMLLKGKREPIDAYSIVVTPRSDA